MRAVHALKRKRAVSPIAKVHQEGTAAYTPSPPLKAPRFDAIDADAQQALPAPLLSLGDLACVHESWLPVLREEGNRPYMRELADFIAAERRRGPVFPPHADVFSALCFDMREVRVVILGQDPYHGVGQAHGLAFSVRRGVQPPPSLVNIYKEAAADLGADLFPTPTHGCLDGWASQGVLLLNTVLTVASGRANSHADKGWETLTAALLRAASKSRSDGSVVFMLWGLPAQKRAAGLIDEGRNLVLSAPHPSPLSSYRGWFGCKHFSAANAYLVARGRTPIDWSIRSAQ